MNDPLFEIAVIFFSLTTIAYGILCFLERSRKEKNKTIEDALNTLQTVERTLETYNANQLETYELRIERLGKITEQAQALKTAFETEVENKKLDLKIELLTANIPSSPNWFPEDVFIVVRSPRTNIAFDFQLGVQKVVENNFLTILDVYSYYGNFQNIETTPGKFRKEVLNFVPDNLTIRRF